MADTMTPLRRVVSGLNDEGRSAVLFDGPSETVIWSADTAPADNSSTADAGGGPFRFPASGSLFVCVDLPPGAASPMHATDTLDYLIVMSGEVVFITESGETTLHAGDVLVDRGIAHGWRNDGDVTCRIINVFCQAKPVGKGATLSGAIEM